MNKKLRLIIYNFIFDFEIFPYQKKYENDDKYIYVIVVSCGGANETYYVDRDYNISPSRSKKQLNISSFEFKLIRKKYKTIFIDILDYHFIEKKLNKNDKRLLFSYLLMKQKKNVKYVREKQ